MKRAIVPALILALLAPVALAAQGSPGEGIMGWLRDNMGMEMGSVTIDGTSYSKVVLSPDIKLGRLKMGLYLPVIYTDDLFDPASWYQPGGNNEWDFGTKYWNTDIVKGTLDAASDLILKIRYLEYGNQLDDPFFFKLGNLQNLTIGHGLIMRDYRNDSDFPSLRRTGVNLGLDFGGFGFEALVNDLPIPEIAGTRLFFRPISGFNLAIGASGVVDFAAANDLAGTAWDAAADNLMFIGTGLDLDFPIIKTNDILSLRAFADAAVTVPYLREGFTSNSVDIPAGLQTGLIWDNGPRNWGAAAGLMGNVLFLDWRLEYRYFTGIFRPAFFDSTYERSRSIYALEYIGYMDGTRTIVDEPTVMGVYGEAGFSLLKDRLSFKAGYMWPWSLDTAFVPGSADDEFHAALIIKKGLIPVVDAAGAIYYDKWGLVNSIVDGTFVLFDEKTAFAGEVEIPVPGTPNLAIGVIFKAIAMRDPTTGNVVYVDAADPSKGIKMTPSFTLETRFRF